MDKNIKEKWVAALRSGDYKQGKYVLRSNDDCYCCLGVLCNITEKGQWRPNYDEEGLPQEYYYVVNEEMDAEMIPCDLRRKIGVAVSTQDELISLNDSGKSFSDIADYIEKNL